jgi:hypothetical protein
MNCKFFAFDEKGNNQVGNCHYDPPRVFPMAAMPTGRPIEIAGRRVEQQPQMMIRSVFPPMPPNGFCGKGETLDDVPFSELLGK